MKQLLTALAGFSIMTFSCQKDKHSLFTYSNPTTDILPTTQPAPLSVFTSDSIITIRLPQDSIRLFATNNQPNGIWDRLSIQWNKIIGKGNPLLHSPNDPNCLATGLQPGGYAFAIKAVAVDGRVASDTQYLFLSRLSANPKELTMGAQVWKSGPFWNRIILTDFAGYLTANGLNASTHFELYIKTKLTNGGWERMGNEESYTGGERYLYAIEANGSLLVFDDTSEGKVGEDVELLLLYD